MARKLKIIEVKRGKGMNMKHTEGSWHVGIAKAGDYAGSY
jgi:hypothetical protein